MPSPVYIVGHKNPDSDSVCSAWAYARLKRRLSPDQVWQDARCGNLNDQTRYIFERWGIRPPRFLADIHPRVSDIMTVDVKCLHQNAPLYEVIRNLNEHRIRVSPIVDEQQRYLGAVSILEVAEYFIARDASQRPVQVLRPELFGQVLPGSYHRRGEQEEFEGKFFVGAMARERLGSMIDQDRERAVLIVGKRRDFIEYSIENQLPALVLTGIRGSEDLDIDFSAYRGWVFVSALDTAETMRQLGLCVPVKALMNSAIPCVGPGDYVDDAVEVLTGSDHKGLPVVDDTGFLQGILTRTNFLQRCRPSLIMMDHNEVGQAIDGAENARICEIVDHHRLGTLRTNEPLGFYAKPVGSTCTLVHQLYLQAGVEPDMDEARILLAGILSDTVITKSPTTTSEDIAAIAALEQIADLDHRRYGQDIFAATAGLRGRDPVQVIEGDFKCYEEFGVRMGIGQVEVVTLADLEDVRQNLLDALERVRRERSLDWSLLLITDIIDEYSLLLCAGECSAETLLQYRRTGDRQYALPGVLSRKKQLLPELLRVLEERMAG